MNQDQRTQKREKDQKERDARNRRKTLVRLLTFAQASGMDAVELMDQVDQLGLQLELAQLAGGDAERHRRLGAARAAAELPDLEEAVMDLTVGLDELGNV